MTESNLWNIPVRSKSLWYKIGKEMVISEIRVVDARMGRGKTTAAINYMSRWKNEKRFLYITPYLKEVDRICEQCNFDQPGNDNATKLTELKHMLWKQKNIASTHALFYLLDDAALAVIRQNHYCIIIDEAIEAIQRVPVTLKDMNVILNQFADVDDGGAITWRDDQYTGKFSGYKELADMKSLYKLDTSLLRVLRPDILESFDEVIMMTYMFMGQYQRAYLDYFGFQYRLCGVDDIDGFVFTDEPDVPPAVDYHDLIQIVNDPRLNAVGDGTHSLSKAWYERRGRDDPEIKALRNHLNTFFRRRNNSASGQQLWTCFKDDAPKLYGPDNRFAGSFLQLSSKASNAYRNRNVVAYLVNRFVDPNINKFFAQRGIDIDRDEFALGEMLQWIWRSSIRDNEPIKLYIPSKRMRELLIGWINITSNGGEAVAQ